jgi:NitT/TauT family transport system substrate-binding protein
MKRLLIALAVIATLLVACDAPPTPTRPAPTVVPTSQPAAPLTEVTVVMGYVPNIQFAPFFVAESKGYFAKQGIKIKYSWAFETEGIKLVGANQAEFALVGGDQVIQARTQKLPVLYVANYYNAFPISIFSLKEKNIKTPKDLIGKKVALPGYFGATYTGWRALMFSAQIKESDVKTQDVGFAQVAAVTQGIVDAAAGYSNNELVQMKLLGKEINVITVADYIKLVGVGIITSEKFATEKPQVVRAMVSALMSGISETIAKPDDALEMSVRKYPDIGGQNITASKAVLDATLALWQAPRLGFVDGSNWLATANFMKNAGIINQDIDVNLAFTNKFVP